MTRGNASTLRLMPVRMDSLVSNSVTERQCATTSREHGEPMRGPSRRPTTLAQATDRIPVVSQGTQSLTHASQRKQAATVHDRHWVECRAANKGHYPETNMASLAGNVSPRQTSPARLVESGPLSKTFSGDPSWFSREIPSEQYVYCAPGFQHTQNANPFRSLLSSSPRAGWKRRSRSTARRAAVCSTWRASPGRTARFLQPALTEEEEE